MAREQHAKFPNEREKRRGRPGILPKRPEGEWEELLNREERGG